MQREFTEAEIDRIVGMAWEDRTTFDVIKDQFGVSESSFKVWRERVHGRKTKHRAKAEKKMDRFVLPDQRHRDKVS
jgi:hypothetical protein